ncbi:lipase maturation factor family protein [Cumulibacter manganitolerans]|uniref:lipase maturation factor family protein n=1 Tax=Cumulibacter manganitolerans TaxID=1884992 RepID=UPI001297F283|nr:lipase maturation factor family protein [Cumulibacter manganitolerans]
MSPAYVVAAGWEWAQAPDAWLGRMVLEHGVAALLLVTLISTINQFPGLLGARGLTPIEPYLRQTRFWDGPSIFRWRYSDRYFLTACWVGVLISAATVAGLTAMLPAWGHMLAWTAMWVLYLSIVNVGQRWYGFLWEMLLCEVLFVCVFIGPRDQVPSTLVIAALIWLLIRVELGAGLIKMRGGKEWRDLTALDYHHETQPMPGPLSWYFHHLPKVLHRVETGANHVVQLVVPFLLLAPQPIRSYAALVMALTQAWLVLSGNFAWVNLLTICLCLSLVADSAVGLDGFRPELAAASGWVLGVQIAFAVLSLALVYHPLVNLFSAQQKMNARYNPLLLGSSYGAFGTIGKQRRELIVEGCTERGEPWREYEFYGKPGDVAHRPPVVAPYHLRLGWQLWFAALSSYFRGPWLDVLTVRLLEGEPAVTRMCRVNPFPDAPPRWIRVMEYDYRYSTRAEKRQTGAWWVRSHGHEVIPPRRLATRP